MIEVQFVDSLKREGVRDLDLTTNVFKGFTPAHVWVVSVKDWE